MNDERMICPTYRELSTVIKLNLQTKSCVEPYKLLTSDLIITLCV
jgi:hypothetical protein